MTREDAIKNLEMIRVAFVEPVTKEQRKLIDDTFDTAVKALEQDIDFDKQAEEVIEETVKSIWGKPCADAVSREAVLKAIRRISLGQTDVVKVSLMTEDYVKKLPPVYPQNTEVLDKIATELKELIKTVDDMGCSTKQFRVALGIVNQYRKGDKE